MNKVKKNSKDVDKLLKNKEIIESIKKDLEKSNNDEELEALIEIEVSKNDLEDISNTTEIARIENTEVAMINDEVKTDTEIEFDKLNKEKEVNELKEKMKEDKKSIDNELKDLFKKMELESEIDKLREDAAKKVYYLDEIYLKAHKEYKYDNEEKFILALFLKDGFTKDKNSSLAITYLNDLAKIGYPPAMIELGEIYYYGIGVSKNRSKAENLFKKAHKYGLDNPGDFFEKRAYAKTLIFGYEVVKDIEKAYLLIKANDQHPFNESLLGHLFYNKEFSLYNKRKAITHWLVAQKNQEETFLIFLKNSNINLEIDNDEMIDSVW